MSSLSDQPPGSLFSEYSELALAPGGGAQDWDWQHQAGGEAGLPRSPLAGGGGSPTPTPMTPLTDEDKLCLFAPPGAGAETKGPAGPLTAVGGVHGAYLGSAGESPDSPPSSSPSPSAVSPMGRLTPSPALGLRLGVSPPPRVPGRPAWTRPPP